MDLEDDGIYTVKHMRERMDKALGQEPAPPLEIPEWGTISTKQHLDEIRLDYLDKHCVIRITRKNKIKVIISAESNGVKDTVLRDYIDMLIEQGAK